MRWLRKSRLSKIGSKPCRKEYENLRLRFIVAAVLGFLTLVGTHQAWFPILRDIPRQTNTFIFFVLTTPVQFWAGWRFYRGVWGVQKRKTADMNVLIAVFASAAYLYSVAVTFAPQIFPEGMAEVYYDTAAAIVALIPLGRLLEARAKGQTSEAIRKLMSLQARTARVVRSGEEVDIPVEEVRVGDLLLNPIFAAAAIGFSTVFVVSNSLRLRVFRPATTAV